MKNSPIAVIGAGSWGTALGILLARNDNPTRIWGNVYDELAGMQQSRSNEAYLPGIPLPEKLTVLTELDEAMKDIDDMLIVVPSHAFRTVLQSLKPYISNKTRIAWATKGLDPDTYQFMHEVLQDELDAPIPMAVISGPSFAREVAEDLPTAVSIAASDDDFSADLIERFKNPHFRLDKTSDLIGVQLCGAVKNVLAIATGIADGLGYGANTQAALITQGLREMTELGLKLGAKQDTFTALAGIGDLVLTATDNQSRNRRFGLALGKGIGAEQAIQEIGQVVEGSTNATQVHQMANQHQVNMPICEQIYRVIEENATPESVITKLINV